MSLKSRSAVVATAALAAVLALPGLAGAQAPMPNPVPNPEKKWVQPPAEVPKAQRGDRTRNIDFLFEALKVAPDDESAKAIENRIWALWLTSGSDTADLLMMRVKQATDGKNLDLGIRLLNAIIEIRPGYIEAWHRRATLFFLKKDYSNSLADIREVLAREPRHFGALAGLGTILSELGDERRALDAFRRAIAVHPRLNGVADEVKSLTEKVEGRPI
jgi:tetratricopeptide (TPR) repeat protein